MLQSHVISDFVIFKVELISFEIYSNSETILEELNEGPSAVGTMWNFTLVQLRLVV